MTDKGAVLNIQMLGEFSIKKDNASVGDDSVRAKKVLNLIEFLVANRKSVISQDKLMEAVWEGEVFDNPLNTLKNMAYRARNVLKVLCEDSDTGIELIKFEGNTYVWNNEIECVVDIEEMERLWNAAQDAECPRDKKIECLYRIQELYKGEFLPKASYCEWVILLNTYYQSVYTKSTKALIELLKEEDSFYDISAICEKYNCIYPYEESIHALLLEAYARSSRLQKTVEHYNYITESFFKEFGIGLTQETVLLYKALTKKAHNVELDIENIQGDLKEADKEKGAFFCDYDVFKNIYRLQARMIQRNGASIYFGLFTITDLEGDMPGKEVVKKTIILLKEILTGSLRRSDVVSKYSTTQMVVLLPYTSYENGLKVCERILQQFSLRNKSRRIKLLSRLQALEPVEI